MSTEEAAKPTLTADDVSDLMATACDFQARSLTARNSCKEQYRRAETGEQNSLRILIDGLLASLVTKISQPIPNVDEKISYQIAIVASTIRSHFVINDLIMNGDILEALTVIRKQLEGIARLNEIDSAPLAKLLGRTPNVKNLFGKQSGAVYGYLSEIAHSASPHIAVLLGVLNDGERSGPSLTPVFSDHLSAAFEVHWFFALYVLVWITRKLSEWYPGYDNAGELRRTDAALSLALAIGVLRYPDPNPGSKQTAGG